MSVIVLGGVTGRVVKLIGERNTVYLGVASSVAAFACYGLATSGWMLYPAIVLGAIGGLVGPASQSLITREVGKDKQGAVQGALSSLGAMCYMIAPLAATWLFGHFSGPGAIAELPGMPFFVGSGIALAGLVVAVTLVRPTGGAGFTVFSRNNEVLNAESAEKPTAT
jgi:DHA1 family tetracycline resistance protein-like MFS transporter